VESLKFEPCDIYPRTIRIALKEENFESCRIQIFSTSTPDVCFEFDASLKKCKCRPHEIPIDIHNVSRMLVSTNGAFPEREAVKIVTSVASILMEPNKWLQRQKQ
jgi:hypothetical protein